MPTRYDDHLALAQRHLADARIRIKRQEQIVSEAPTPLRQMAQELLSLLSDIEHQMLRHYNLMNALPPRQSSKAPAPIGGALEAAHYRKLGRRTRQQALALGPSRI